MIQDSSEIPQQVSDYLRRFTDPEAESVKVFMTTTVFNISNLEKPYEAIINLRRVNDVRFINKFQETVNEKLLFGGLFIGFVETQEQRAARLLQKFPWGIAHLYLFFDFIFKRVFPKLPFFKKIYFFITNGRNRVMSKAETLGRLVSCGFHIQDVTEIGNYTYFTAKKVKEPVYDINPSYGPLFAMNRIGKNGKLIRVYKFRTMYPFAEYLQEYIYEQNKLAKGGKFADDFRITAWGRFLRRFWLDELPMIYNLFKGDIKLVGVRPLSRHYYSLYTKELQEKRLYSKPGLLPPFYVDMPNTLEEIIDSELKYLRLYEVRPVSTDLRYFLAIFSNIVLKRLRSN